MIMDVAPADVRYMRHDQFWDWGPSMYTALQYAYMTGVRRRVFGVRTAHGWHYRVGVSSRTWGK